jgi:hypothetical protein
VILPVGAGLAVSAVSAGLSVQIVSVGLSVPSGPELQYPRGRNIGLTGLRMTI